MNVLSIFSGILGLVVLVGTFWTLLGVPAAIIIAIIRIFDKKDKAYWKKPLLWSLVGIPLLVAGFILQFILGIIAGFFGIDLSVSLPRP